MTPSSPVVKTPAQKCAGKKGKAKKACIKKAKKAAVKKKVKAGKGKKRRR